MDCTAVDSWFFDMDFESCLSAEEANNNVVNTSTTTLMNIPSADSLTSLCAEDFTDLLLMEDANFDDDELEQQPPPPPSKLKRLNDYDSSILNCSPPAATEVINTVVTCSSTPIILNFENGNSSPGGGANYKKSSNTVKSRDLNPEEEAFVSEVLRFQDHGSSAPKGNNDAANDDGNNNNNNVLKEKLRCVEVKKKNSRVRQPSQNYDHIIAERKRREQLSQKFLTLSTIVPGLKKMDKTSVLNDAIKYLKQLQDKVKTLEAQATKHTVESFVLVKKSKMTIEDDDDDGEDNNGGGGGGNGRNICSREEKHLPKIKASLCGNQIQLKIQSHNRAGVIAKLLGEVDKLKLSVVSINAATFGNFALDVMIIAEMERDFGSTMSEVVGRLRVFL